jgi:hypothetical protein
MPYAQPDPSADPRDHGLASLTPGGPGPHYPKTDHHTWCAFAMLVIEMGGYSDLEAINPYTGDRLWVGGPDAGHEYCTNRCNTCGLATYRYRGELVHNSNETTADHPATETTDCAHNHGGRVGIMSNNDASNRYFRELRVRVRRAHSEDRDNEHVDGYEQLRRLVDVMEAAQFMGNE